VTDYLFFKQNAFLDTLPPFLQGLAKATVGSPTRAVLVEVIESSITKQFVELMSSADAAKMLRELAELVDRFPVQKGSLYFGDNLSAPDWFKPTFQDGLKAVMLGAFFAVVEKRPLAPESLPTIGELDALVKRVYIRNNKSEEKNPPGDKELREARCELGLSGLPRGKGGRPKKQRGKK
jgi:hypothetical protein